jgi:hypothetical protein
LLRPNHPFYQSLQNDVRSGIRLIGQAIDLLARPHGSQLVSKTVARHNL